MIRDARNDGAQIGFRLDAVHLGGFNQRVNDGGAVAAIVRTSKEPVLAANGDGPDGAFSSVIADVEASKRALTQRKCPLSLILC
jgi:hypothetical protein